MWGARKKWKDSLPHEIAEKYKISRESLARCRKFNSTGSVLSASLYCDKNGAKTSRSYVGDIYLAQEDGV